MIIDGIPQIAGMVYAIAATTIIALLLRRRRFNKKTGYIFLAASTFLGFLMFTPMLPYQFQTLILGNIGQLGGPLPLAIMGLGIIAALTIVAGRVFCGYVCPIGTAQELLFNIPAGKCRIRKKSLPVIVRYVFLAAFIATAVTSSVGLLNYLGLRDFFYLNTWSAFFYVFLGLMVLSVFLYRPFCRFACPYGVILSLATIKSRFNLRRNGNCTDCAICEEECPTSEAGRGDRKQECYQCQRCVYICPYDAIDYSTNQGIVSVKKII